MKSFIIAIITILTVGCTTLETLGDYVSENELFTSIAARQAVGRYIAAGDTLESENERARKVESILTKANKYLDGNPIATTDGLFEVVNSAIKWEALSISDRILIQDILLLLKSELKDYELENNITDKSKIAIRSLFDTAISAARVYLMR
jgi:hypothetical protein